MPPILFSLLLQMPQNPSPMVENTREHPRIPQESPAGRRFAVDLGTLFVPRGSRPELLVFFHGGQLIPEAAAFAQRQSAVTIQLGPSSDSYVEAFQDQGRFLKLLDQVKARSGVAYSNVILAGWSAGCGGVRQIIRDDDAYKRISKVLCIDGMHAGYEPGSGPPGTKDTKLELDNLTMWLRLAKDSIAGRKRFVLTHSEVFPGTFASTTETADWLLAQLKIKRTPVLKWGAAGTQQLSEVDRGKLHVLGFAGNSAPDHVDQLYTVSKLLAMMRDPVPVAPRPARPKPVSRPGRSGPAVSSRK